MDFYKLLKTIDTLNEGTMKSAEQHKSGPEFTGYWKGTDKRTPGTHMVGGGMEESQDDGIENEVRRGWKEYISELGADNAPPNTITPQQPATSTGTTTAANTQQDANKIKQSLQSIKSKVPGLDVNKATQALTKTDADQSLGATDQAALAGMAEPLAGVAKNPQLAGQLTQLFNKGLQAQTAAKQTTPGAQ